MLKTSILAAVTFLLSIAASGALVYSASGAAEELKPHPVLSTNPSPAEILTTAFASSNVK